MAGAPPEEIAPLGMPHVHPAIQRHPVTGEECLYLPMNPDGLFDTRTGRHWAANQDVWARIEAAGFAYDHQWREGDLLLWDNLQAHAAAHPRPLLTAWCVPIGRPAASLCDATPLPPWAPRAGAASRRWWLWRPATLASSHANEVRDWSRCALSDVATGVL